MDFKETKGINFDAEKVRDKLIEEIRNTGFKKVILGISGGKDSSVAAALCARALGPENVYGIMLPDGVQKDLSDSQRICEALKINARTVNIGPIHTALNAQSINDTTRDDIFPDGTNESKMEHESDINVGPRLRMTVLRYLGQSIGALVCGTGNLSESVVGYCTKDGDTSCDFNPLGALTSIEVVEVGKTMEELPRELVEKTPSDGLSGMSDEEKLGIKYTDIHKYIRLGTSGNEEIDKKITEKYNASFHKRQMPRVLNPFE